MMGLLKTDVGLTVTVTLWVLLHPETVVNVYT